MGFWVVGVWVWGMWACGEMDLMGGGGRVVGNVYNESRRIGYLGIGYGLESTFKRLS